LLRGKEVNIPGLEKLHMPSTKLAGLYLAIIMAISLFFSANVYQLSLQEFNRGLMIRNDVITPGIPGTGALELIQNKLQAEQARRYADARDRVVVRLVLINLGILVGGGVLSYYLARRTLRPIEEAHEAQSRFTADASHELRTPLAAMQSENEVALMKPNLTLAEAKSLLNSNLEELARLTALSEGLLRLSQLEHGTMDHQRVAVDDIVQRAIDRVLPSAEKKHILIHPKGAKRLQVTGDVTSLTEAVVILLDNAVKYSPEKTEVVVSARKEQRTVTITVRDNGHGIKASELPHIFDRFYRADAARSKQNVSGYGLGLAIAKNIVDLHGGKITVQSAPGAGSEFMITLPVRV
jgi:two-component system sensor histidine kinase CiaH